MGKLTAFTYAQTGGFAGVNRAYKPDLAKLEKKDREKLEELVDKSGLLKIRGEEKKTAGACDMFNYEFSATEHGVTHKASYDDGTLPSSYKELVKYLKDKAADLPRGQ